MKTPFKLNDFNQIIPKQNDQIIHIKTNTKKKIKDNIACPKILLT